LKSDVSFLSNILLNGNFRAHYLAHVHSLSIDSSSVETMQSAKASRGNPYFCLCDISQVDDLAVRALTLSSLELFSNPLHLSNSPAISFCQWTWPGCSVTRLTSAVREIPCCKGCSQAIEKRIYIFESGELLVSLSDCERYVILWFVRYAVDVELNGVVIVGLEHMRDAMRVHHASSHLSI
jgi:hypothetical protein